jgi:hypothetical protein
VALEFAVSDRFAFGDGVLVLSDWVIRNVDSLSERRILVKRFKSPRSETLSVLRCIRCRQRSVNVATHSLFVLGGPTGSRSVFLDSFLACASSRFGCVTTRVDLMRPRFFSSLDELISI